MRVLLFLLLVVGFLGTARAEESPEKLAELAELYADVERRLTEHEKRAEHLDGIGYGGAVLQKDLKELAARVKGLQAELAELDKELGIDGEEGLQPFDLRVSLGDYDGPPVDRPLVENDIIAFQAEVPLPGSAEELVLTDLIWQLYDPSKKPVAGVAKVKRISAMGGKEATRFKMRAADMDNGTYTVALTHRLAVDPATYLQASSAFEYKQPVRIVRLAVADNPAAEPDLKKIHPEQAPHLYAYFTLEEGVERVSARLQVLDPGKKVLREIDVIRPRKEGPQQRVGLGLKPGVLQKEGRYTFKAALSEGGKGETVREKAFDFGAYHLSISAPDAIVSGETERFSIQAPAAFVRPFKVEVEADYDLTLGHHAGSLSGTVSGIAQDFATSSKIEATVTDAEGRVARGTEWIDLKPKPKAPPPSVVFSSSGGGMDSAKARGCYLEALRTAAADDVKWSGAFDAARNKCRALDIAAGIQWNKYKPPLANQRRIPHVTCRVHATNVWGGRSFARSLGAVAWKDDPEYPVTGEDDALLRGYYSAAFGLGSSCYSSMESYCISNKKPKPCPGPAELAACRQKRCPP